MRLLTSIFLALFFGICCSAVAQEGFELPAEGDTPIFTMEFGTAGLRMPRKNPLPADWVKKPYLQIFADGRVLKSPNAPEYPAYEIQLNEEELNAFLDKVVNEHKFYEIDLDEIAKEKAEAAKGKGGIGIAPRMADAPGITFSMELGRGSHSYQTSSAKSSARLYPNIEALQNIVAIENAARRMVFVAVAGGFDNLERALEKVNEGLEAEGHEPMTMDLLVGCRKRKGVTTITFSRKTRNAQDRRQHWVNGSFIIDGDDESVKVSSSKKK